MDMTIPVDSLQLPDERDALTPPRSQDERTWAALAHACVVLNFAVGLGGLIGAAVIWLTKKEESDWVAFHGLQSLAFQAVQLVVTLVVVGGTWVLGFAFSFVTLGFGTLVAVPLMFLTFFLGILMMVGGMAYSLYGAYRIYNGQEFRYLWVGDWIARQSAEPTPGELHRPFEAEQAHKNTTLIIVVVAVALVLCVLCVVLGVVLLGVLGGTLYWSSSALLPTLFGLV
jgi:uncharacterized Tic20 family protein